jgi:hypothetical protein
MKSLHEKGPILLSHRTLNGSPQHPVGRASIGEGFPCIAMIMEPRIPDHTVANRSFLKQPNLSPAFAVSQGRPAVEECGCPPKSW